MMNRWLGIAFAAGLFMGAAPAFAGGSGLPQDVTAFQNRRDRCDHFRGEDAYDAKREKFLAAQVKKYCTGTDTQLKRLKARYKADRSVLRAVSGYDEKIE